MSAITHIIARCGYVESNSVSAVIWTTTNGVKFKDKKSALRSLSTWLLEKFKEDTEYEKKKNSACCLSSKTKFCGTCGKRVQDAKEALEIDAEEFIDWYRGVERSDCDSFGAWDYIESEDGLLWTPWGKLKNPSFYDIEENFQKELVETLGLEGETW